MTDRNDALSRIVGVEEHVAFPDLMRLLPDAGVVARGYQSRDAPFGRWSLLDQLSETDDRVDALEEAGVTVQVLSYPLAGAEVLPAAASIEWARSVNDELGRRIARHPTRYAGFAHLPLADPRAAADELERAVTQIGLKGALVNGATDGRYLDHADFDPVLARLASLDVPVYLHPAPSPAGARDALYGGLPGDLGFWLSTSGFGWHADTAIHVLRLLLSGAFGRHPGLKVIIGHLGEGLQVMMPRLDQQFHQFAGFEGVPSEIIRRHVWVSTGGFFMHQSFMAALDAFGPDRLLYSVDYPFGSLEHGMEFLRALPVDNEILARLAHRNADALLKLTGQATPS